MTKTGGTGKNLKSGKGSISVNKNVILLIEDEEKLSRTLAEYLELNGYRLQSSEADRGSSPLLSP